MGSTAVTLMATALTPVSGMPARPRTCEVDAAVRSNGGGGCADAAAGVEDPGGGEGGDAVAGGEVADDVGEEVDVAAFVVEADVAVVADGGDDEVGEVVPAWTFRVEEASGRGWPAGQTVM